MKTPTSLCRLGLLIVGFGLLFKGYSQSFLTNGLVAYYPFNGNANDAFGTNNGTVVGTDIRYLPDRFGVLQASLFLNTTSTAYDAYVTAPRATTLDFTADFTLSVWVNLLGGTTPAGPHDLISNGSYATSVNLRLISDWTDSKDFLQVIWDFPSTEIDTLVDSVRQMWWQIVVVHSGTTVTVYKNASSLTKATAGADVPVNTPTIFLGRTKADPFSVDLLVGGIDDVRIYNRALSAAEVQQLYQYEAGPPMLTPRLTITPAGANVILAWPTNATGFTLQSAPTLTATFTSIPGATSPYTNAITASQQYFRLATP